jgi:hypothetical protein
MSEYRKFIARPNAAPQKTLASLATLAEPISGPCLYTDKARPDPPKTQSGPAKPAKVAKVCVQCNASDEPLWRFDTEAGPVLIHEECARFWRAEPPTEPAPPTLAYHGASAEPDGTGCKVEIVELPATGLRYRRTYAHLQLRPPGLHPRGQVALGRRGRKALPAPVGRISSAARLDVGGLVRTAHPASQSAPEP